MYNIMYVRYMYLHIIYYVYSVYSIIVYCVLFYCVDILVATPNRLVHMLKQQPPTISLGK